MSKFVPKQNLTNKATIKPNNTVELHNTVEPHNTDKLHQKPKKKRKKKALPLDLAADILDASLADSLDEDGNPVEQIPKEDLPVIKVSVRSLVAFALPDEKAWAYVSYADMREGSKTHQALQTTLAGKGPYRPEVPLSYTFDILERRVELSGRVDGIFNEDTVPMLHEIKSTAIPLTEIPLAGIPSHWAQLICYAAIVAKTKNASVLPVRLSYVNRQDGSVKDFDRVLTGTELTRFIEDLLKPYVKREKDRGAWLKKRDDSIQKMVLPFKGGFRKSQKLLAYNVYRCVGDSKRLFAQAPTGTGKTMGALYPVLKAMGEGQVDRIFYVTAKTTTKAIAENAITLLQQEGLRLKVLVLTAKDKMCLMTVKNCDPAKCPYAEGIFTRMQRVSKTLIKTHDVLTRDVFYKAGLKHEVCPFELSLEASLDCDLIIADYNYVFDPRVYLKRFFQQKGKENYVILVDEAHNLVDRAREMYSASLVRENLMALRRKIYKDQPELSVKIGAVLRTLTLSQLKPTVPLSEMGGQEYRVDEKVPQFLMKPINTFLVDAEPLLTEKDEEDKNPPLWQDEFVGVYFDLLHFRNTLELFGPEYRTVMTGRNRSYTIQLKCLDPSAMLNKRMDAARSTILFSATLSPLTYFRLMLGGRDSDPTLRLPSPFPRENLQVMIDDRVETRYQMRTQHIPGIVQSLYTFLSAHKGNYLVFFPSYGYMNQVLNLLEERYHQEKSQNPKLWAWDVLVQESGMSEPDREKWLLEFERFGDSVRVGFCVLGGAFSEGIDLAGERLTGVAVVGVGLPQVNPEQEISRVYFQARFGEGFDFAYTYPGLNRVLQAAGRLIRTMDDRGGLLLLDTRFANRTYQKLLPPEWYPLPYLSQKKDLSQMMQAFWSEPVETE